MAAEQALTPQERLALSRRAITRQLMRRGHDDGDGSQSTNASTQAMAGGSSWWQILRNAGLSWWQHHPAHTAAEVAAPVVKAYARERPIQILGIAAGAGAAVMLLRPWRRAWFSRAVTGAIGSMDISSIALSMLTRQPNNHYKRTQDD